MTLTRDKFTIRGVPMGEENELREVIDLYSNRGEIPMWMRAFLGYAMKIWLQWLLQKKMQTERGVPGVPEHRQINPDDRIYFLTQQEMAAVVHAADCALLEDLVDDEDSWLLQVARAKIKACAEINSKEGWMYGPTKTEGQSEEGE